MTNLAKIVDKESRFYSNWNKKKDSSALVSRCPHPRKNKKQTCSAYNRFSWQSVSFTGVAIGFHCPSTVIKSNGRIFSYEPKGGLQPISRDTDNNAALLYTLTFGQQNEHCDWLILGHVALIKFKCIPTGMQFRSCCPLRMFCCDCCRKSLNI